MRALIEIEVTKIAYRRLNQVVLALLCGMLVLVYVLLWMASGVVADIGAPPEAATRLRSALYLQETVPFAMLMLYAFGFVAGVVVIGANVGAEYTWNTVRTVTAAEPQRPKVLLAKLIALWALVVAGLFVALLVTLVTSMVITVFAGEFDLSFVDGGYVRESSSAFLRMLVGTGPYFALAFMLGTIGRSATAGIALALGVAFLEGIVGGLLALSGGWLADLTWYMLDTNADTLALAESGQFGQLFGGDGAMSAVFDRPSVTHAVVVLLTWTALLLSGAFWGFQRQDLGYEG